MIEYAFSRLRPSSAICVMRFQSPFTPRLITNISVRLASTKTDTKQTCLHDFHNKRAAKMEPFAGFMMPIFYRNQTIKAEHLQTRNSASAFDVSHMMQVKIKGKGSCKFLESLTVSDVERMKVNRCTLSVFLNESGGIIDDCIISKRPDHIHIVSNAGNADIVWSWLVNYNSNHLVELERLEGRGLIALQGPLAAKVLQSLVDTDLSEIDFMNTLDTPVNGVGTCQITRCGYTGEDGFEISVENSAAPTLMELLCDRKEVKPAGLGARDTLRLEAGLCLHGHDISDKTSPVEAGLSWTIHKRRRVEANFIGSKTVLDQLKNGCEFKRAGLVATKSGPPAREGSKVFSKEGEELGNVTSGNFAPSLHKNIAMAYLPTTVASNYDQLVDCNIRGKNYEYLITKMPFVKTNYFLKKC